MKKYISILLCTAALLLGFKVPTALAASSPYYPISVEQYTYGSFDELRIDKVYQLSLSDDPSGIPTEDFERDGRLYYLLDMTRADSVGVDTQTHTETVTMDSDTGEMSEVLKLLDGQMEITTDDGYTGVLLLDHTSITVEVKGYKTSTRNLKATRTYPNLSDADLSLIPRTIEDGGKTLTLADVQWSGDGLTYTASATYTGSSSSRYATGYTVKANYTGEVAKTNCEVVTYTATFGSKELPKEDQAGSSEPAEQPLPIFSERRDYSLLAAAGLGGAGVLLAVFVLKSMKGAKRDE